MIDERKALALLDEAQQLMRDDVHYESVLDVMDVLTERIRTQPEHPTKETPDV